MAVGRDDYEERREARIDRLNGLSSKAAQEGRQKFQRAHDISRQFEGGQPILVGHHSEKQARGAQKRMWAATERGVALEEKAGYYAGKAEAAENNTAISSDNPDAVALLEAKIEKLSQYQADMKAANAYWRKHKTMKGCPGVSDDEAAQIDEQMKTACSWVQKNGPCEDWRLSNNSATIRQAKARLEQLRALDEMPAEVIPFDGGKIEVDIEENRVKITFNERQSDEVTAKLKQRGFKWSRTNRCWQRLRTKHALWAARDICGVKGVKTAGVSESGESEDNSPADDTPVNKQKEGLPVEHKWDMEKIKWNRLAPFNVGPEVVDRMAESNIGAMNFVLRMISEKRFMEIFMCDNLKLYGGMLYMFWNDCCQRNMEKASDILYQYNRGEISGLFISRHIQPCRGIPIKTHDEWKNSGKSLSEFHQAGDLVPEDTIAFLSELGVAGVIKKEIYLQLRSVNHRYISGEGGATPLYSTYKQISGVWAYIGLCAKLPEDFCGACPCNSCLQTLPEGKNDECHACDICIDGDISPLAPHCMLNKRGADLVRVYTSDEAERMWPEV